MLWSSWHNHTGDGSRFSYCADPDVTPEYYRRALRGGVWQRFAITEHAFALAIPAEDRPWPHQWYHHPERLWSERAFREDKTAQFIERMADICDGKQIFGGLEVEVAFDGSLSMESLLWPYLDVVIGSIHYVPGEADTRYENYVRQLDMLLEYPIDILGHPFRPLGQDGPVPEEILDETLQRARAVGVAIEINAHMPFPQDSQVLAKAVQLELPVAFGLDAHHRRELELHTYFAEVVAGSGVEVEKIKFYQHLRKCPKPRVLVR